MDNFKRGGYMPKASAKIMRSYDYGHFEICLGSDNDLTLEAIDDMRKDAQRLVDKAVTQYKIAKQAESDRINAEGSAESLRKEVKIIMENFPKSEWTPEQKAKVKKLDQYEYALNHHYDYDDDWEENL